jgi:hypothetical protein
LIGLLTSIDHVECNDAKNKFKRCGESREGGDTHPTRPAAGLHAVTVHFFSCDIERSDVMSKKGIEYLRRKLISKQARVNMRYKRYAMKYTDNDISATIPKQLKDSYKTILGWCTKGVDALGDRLIFREFTNDDFEVNEIFQANNPDVFFDSAVLSALIASCSFVYISKVEEELPRLQVIEASNATGIIDPITGLLTEGYVVLERDDSGVPLLEAYFTSEYTTFYYADRNTEDFSIPNPTNHPLLVPIIHRPDAERPFGRSRITRAGINILRDAQKILMLSKVTADFYSFPQKYVVGLSNDAEPLDSWKATVSAMLQFTKDDDGEKPTLGQFTSPSMTPFVDQLRMEAQLFAGEMGITSDDLGFVSDNPSSAEAIKASHEPLLKSGRKAQRSLGSGFLNVAYLAACLRDDYPYLREQFVNTQPKWEPLFEADASMLSLIGDGAIKLNQAIEGFVDGEMIRDLTGVKGAGDNG